MKKICCLCMVLTVFLVAGSQAGFAKTEIRQWSSPTCREFEFTFHFHLDPEANVTKICFFVNPSYTGNSPEFTVPLTGDPLSLDWQANIDGKIQTLVSGDLWMVIPSGDTPSLLFGNFRYFCSKKFSMFDESHFKGALFLLLPHH